MSLRRSALLPAAARALLVVVCALFFSQPFTRAADVSLLCINDWNGSLFTSWASPRFSEVLRTRIVILTDAGTPIGSHSVLVRDPVWGYNKGVFYFSVGAQGKIVIPLNAETETHSYGPSPDGQEQVYSATTIGFNYFGGNNLPGFGPHEEKWVPPPVYDEREFLLDFAVGWVQSGDNYRHFYIESNYKYSDWGWGSFLGYQISYLPGASPLSYKDNQVVFDLRGGLKKAPHQPQVCSACKTCPGMAVASLDKFHAGIVIRDTPIGYTPGLGRSMDFTLSYQQRMSGQPTTFISSHVGPRWQFNWGSYIEGGPTQNKSDAIYHAPDGSTQVYSGYYRTLASLGGVLTNEGEFFENDSYSHARLSFRLKPHPTYQRDLPDGTVELYEQAAGSGTHRLFFLSLVVDPQGNTTTFNYDATLAAGGKARLTSVVDPKGGKLIFGYDSADPLRIARVTRSTDNLSAQLQYDGDGQLIAITDTIGMTSSFTYVSGHFVRTMTTPYGTSEFFSADSAEVLQASLKNPLGQVESVEYRQTVSTTAVPDEEAHVPEAEGLTVANANLNTANTFYWSRRVMDELGNVVDSDDDYAKAEITHWAQGLEGMNGSIAVPLSTKQRLEGRVWYNYRGQNTAATHVSLQSRSYPYSSSPTMTARLLDNAATPSAPITQATQAVYNNNGMLIVSVDPLGRTTDYIYAGNETDLLQVEQRTSSGQEILSTIVYNDNFQPLTITDASGQETHLAYNAQGQLLTRTNAKSETTTLTYDSRGYVATVTGPVGGATTTYVTDASGRVTSTTDSEGYTVTTAYDNLDRPTTSTYPDATTDLVTYDKLDVVAQTDRQGRVTRSRYDAIRQLLQTTDPLGRTTGYTWCTCGGLSTLTDANGNVTTWGLDSEGRVTSKTYADSSVISYEYEALSGRLHQMTDARGNTAVYAYNDDNTLDSTDYTPASGVAATPDVRFTYDPDYNRVLTMVDGTGTTTYAYQDITGSVTTGAGRLQTVTVPIAGTTAEMAYTYDELGRVTTRTIDGGSNSASTTFDTLGRVTGVSNPLGAFTYAYVNQTGRLSGVTYPTATGLTTAYSYFNNAGNQRLQTIQHKQGSTQISRFDYTYNPVGTIATWTTQADSSTAIVNTLTYDAVDQLTGAVQSGGGSDSNAYRYDPAGNRLSEVVNGSSTIAGQFNNLNQLKATTSSTTATTVTGFTSAPVTSVTVNAVPVTSITNGTNFSATVPLPKGDNTVSVVAQPATGPATTKRYTVPVTGGSTPTELTYDANGNTLTDENGNAYHWDALNRLTAIVYTTGTYAGTHTEFAYDGLSRRVSIVERTGTTVGSGTITSDRRYLWLGTEIAEERSDDNTVTKRFYAQGEQQAGTAYYYTRDHLGSVREMCNGSGGIVSRLSYDPYGKATVVGGSSLPFYQYAKMVKHVTSGKDMAVYRFCGGGRWLSRDPIGESGGINIYNYVADNPVNYADPLGLKPLYKKMLTYQEAVDWTNRIEYNQTINGKCYFVSKVHSFGFIRQYYAMVKYDDGDVGNAMGLIGLAADVLSLGRGATVARVASASGWFSDIISVLWPSNEPDLSVNNWYEVPNSRYNNRTTIKIKISDCPCTSINSNSSIPSGPATKKL